MGFFLISIVGHWTFAWFSYVNQQNDHNVQIEFQEYFIETIKDTLENWQSEFLQLMWQVGGLAFLLYVGSPQSKESSERVEEKIDYIIKKVYPNADIIFKELAKKFPKQ